MFNEGIRMIKYHYHGNKQKGYMYEYPSRGPFPKEIMEDVLD